MILVCRDMDYINMFMSQPDVFKYCSEFGTSIDDVNFKHDERAIWLNYTVDGEQVGLINAQISTGVMCTFHPYINKDRRHLYGDMIKELFKWLYINMPSEIVKFNAVIPTLFKGAIKAANAAKMKNEGLDRMSFRHKTGLYDRVLFGITREEMKWVV